VDSNDVELLSHACAMRNLWQSERPRALLKRLFQFVTLDTSQPASVWSNEIAEPKSLPMSVTLATFQASMSWSNDLADENI
jgi:hypothetical protein